MPGILYRYLLRSLAASWAGVAGILLLVLVISQVPNVLNRALTREIAPELVVQVTAWITLANMPAVLPISLLLAIVLTLGRLGSDSELTAMRAGGVSMLGLLVPVALLTAPLALLQGAITLQLAPQALCSVLKARSQAARSLALGPVRAGVFQPFGSGSSYFVSRVDTDGTLHDLFISRGDSGPVEVILAARGRVSAFPEQDRLRLQLFDGRRYEGSPGTANFRILSFDGYEAWIPLPTMAGRCDRPDSRPTAALFASSVAAERAELNWRLGMTATLLVLALFAVPLAIIRPRQGRLARVPAALGVFVVYFLTAISLTTYTARNPALGSVLFWALHALVLLVGAVWLAARQGLLHRRRGTL
jgi:lipopolysaccharide export system permease protein